MPKLCIAIGVILSFLQLPVALQTVILLVQELGHPHVTDSMILLT